MPFYRVTQLVKREIVEWAESPEEAGEKSHDHYAEDFTEVSEEVISVEETE